MNEFYESDANSGHIQLATEILKRLRQVAEGEAIVIGMSIYHVNEVAAAVRERIRLANATIEDIGFSEAKLEQLLKDAPVNVARKAIERIRNDIYKYDDAKDLSYCLSAGAKLEDLDTDEAEIASLTIEYYKLHGTNMMQKVRDGEPLLHRQPSAAAGITYLRKWVDEHQLTLTDISTDEDELTALTARAT